jgi:hypothetical protein
MKPCETSTFPDKAAVVFGAFLNCSLPAAQGRQERWSPATADTQITLRVAHDQLSITALKNIGAPLKHGVVYVFRP